MRESWLICAHYLGRISRKPWLIAFLFAIPFLLLLAEFAAFGRTLPIEQVTPVRLAVTSTGWANSQQKFLSCLAGQKGHPIELVEGDSAGLDLLVFEHGGVAHPTIKFASGASTENQVLESSILRMCITPSHSFTTSVLIARAPGGLVGGAGNSQDFLARFAPGLALFGALFLSQAMASLVWRDQEREVQKRLLAFPIWRGALAIGPLLYLALGVSCALTVMLAATSFAVDLPALRTPLLVFIAVGFGLFAAGLQLSIGLWAGSQRAAQAVSASTNMMLAFFGGGFVPLQLYPPFLRAVAYGLPNGAAQAALTQILQGRGAFSALALHTATVWIWAAAPMATALFMQVRKSA